MTSNLNFKFLLMAFFAIGCGGSTKQVQQTAQQPVPEWVNSRPISSAFYIGVGSASKVREPIDFQNVAKKNALNDLVSEIRVTVKGETFLNSMEVNRKFTEEFNSSIKTYTNEEIEKFEVVGIWENKTEYWIYYRLSKSEHARLKKDKKDKALSSAADFYAKAKDAEMTRNVSAAADFYIRGLMEMKNYWDEVNEYNLNGRTVFLDNEIYSDLRNLLNDLQIEPGLSAVELSVKNNFSQTVPLLVSLRGNPVSGVRVTHNYDRGRFVAERSNVTDATGRIDVLVEKANVNNKENELKYRIDYAVLADNSADRKLVSALLEPFDKKRFAIPIRYVMPSVSVVSVERVGGAVNGRKGLAEAATGALSQNSFRATVNGSQPDLRIDIESDAFQGGESKGFHVAFLNFTVSVYNNRLSKEIYRNTFTDIKGVQLSPEAAVNDAYRRASDQLRDEIIPLIIKSIM
jgi:hypothetical protein